MKPSDGMVVIRQRQGIAYGIKYVCYDHYKINYFHLLHRTLATKMVHIWAILYVGIYTAALIMPWKSCS